MRHERRAAMSRIRPVSAKMIPFTAADVCWCQPFDGPEHPDCPMHGGWFDISQRRPPSNTPVLVRDSGGYTEVAVYRCDNREGNRFPYDFQTHHGMRIYDVIEWRKLPK